MIPHTEHHLITPHLDDTTHRAPPHYPPPWWYHTQSTTSLPPTLMIPHTEHHLITPHLDGVPVRATLTQTVCKQFPIFWELWHTECHCAIIREKVRIQEHLCLCLQWGLHIVDTVCRERGWEGTGYTDWPVVWGTVGEEWVCWGKKRVCGTVGTRCCYSNLSLLLNKWCMYFTDLWFWRPVLYR